MCGLGRCNSPDLTIVNSIQTCLVSIVSDSYPRHHIPFSIPEPDYKYMRPLPLVVYGQLCKDGADLQEAKKITSTLGEDASMSML